MKMKTKYTAKLFNKNKIVQCTIAFEFESGKPMSVAKDWVEALIAESPYLEGMDVTDYCIELSEGVDDNSVVIKYDNG